MHPIMVNSSASDSTSNVILNNLFEVDATLATQEVVLITQLEAVRKKRDSLKTVIDLFSTTSTPSISTHSVTETAISVPISPDREAATTSVIPVASPLKRPKVEKHQQPRRASKAAKESKTVKSSKNWQDYLQPAFQNNSLSTAIAAVFQQQPQELLSVAALMDAIFVDSLPQGMHATIRHRILNILSTGAKEGQWYRGQRGQYSLSRI